MTSYEKLLNEADNNNVQVIENYDFSNTRLKGLYCDSYIALSSELGTEAEKNSILHEELGHHHTSTGNILDVTDLNCIKQERQARIWAYNNAIGLYGIISSYKQGCKNQYEMAEYLNITEIFLKEALAYYKERYGIYTRFDNYMIFFEPLGVFELYK